MEKEYDIVRIDTDKPSNLFLSGKELILGDVFKNELNSNQLLLALSDKKPEVGDWAYNVECDEFYVDEDCSILPSDRKIVASNSKELTPTALFDNSYIETYAKKFNAGNAPKKVRLKQEVVMSSEKKEGMQNYYSHYKLKTSNNFVIVAEQEEKGSQIISNYMVMHPLGEDWEQLSTAFNTYEKAILFLKNVDKNKYPHPRIMGEFLNQNLNP